MARVWVPRASHEFILDAAGVSLEEDKDAGLEAAEQSEPEETKRREPLSSYSMTELNQLLTEVLADEDYERAAEIRDEINRRKTGA